MKMRLKAVIADDEPLARERLRLLLSHDEEIEVCAECRNGREVVATLKDNSIDVVFLDIQMPGQDGFDVIAQVGAMHMPVIVFVTAHNQFALRAFEVRALDYLTKPVELERLRATLARVRESIASRGTLLTHEQLRSVLENLSDRTGKEYARRFLVPNGAKDCFVNVDDIEWIEAADYYSCLHVGTRNLMLRETIKQLAGTLDPQRFVRIHRSTIVNIERVREILREGRSEGWVILTNGQRLKMSRAGWQSLLATSQS